MNFESGLTDAASAATREWAPVAAPAELAERSRDRELADQRSSAGQSLPPARVPAIPPRLPRPQFRLQIRGAMSSRELPVPAARTRPPPLARTSRATGRARNPRRCSRPGGSEDGGGRDWRGQDSRLG